MNIIIIYSHVNNAEVFFFDFYSIRVVYTSKQLFEFSSMPGPNSDTVLKPYFMEWIGIDLDESI